MWDEREIAFVQKVDLSLHAKSPHEGPCPGAGRHGPSRGPKGGARLKADDFVQPVPFNPDRPAYHDA